MRTQRVVQSDKGPKNVFVHALLRQGVQCGGDQSTRSHCNNCNIHSNPLTPGFVFISHSSAWFINSYCSSWPLTSLQVSLQLHFSVTFSRSTYYLYYWCNISLCVSVCVCTVCHSYVDQKQTEETQIAFHSQRTALLAAYLPNPSSVAKDPLPCVTPSRCHLGNRCRGELPAGVVDLHWLRSIELQSTALQQDVCGWTDMQKIARKCRNQAYVIGSAGIRRISITLTKTGGIRPRWCGLVVDFWGFYAQCKN